jgi:hypothetical protein
MSDLDPRIGVYADSSDPKSKTVWPEKTVGGRDYQRPTTTLDLDKHAQPEGYAAKIESLRAATTKAQSVSTPATRPTAVEPKKKESDGAE